MITGIFGDREWVGEVAAGLAILGCAAYRLASFQNGSLISVAAALVLAVTALGLFGARRAKPMRVDDKKSL